jgi:hypothetical protein
MKVLLLNGSANKNGNTFTALSQIARQLKKIHANGNPDYPEREPWQGMNFIR